MICKTTSARDQVKRPPLASLALSRAFDLQHQPKDRHCKTQFHLSSRFTFEKTYAEQQSQREGINEQSRQAGFRIGPVELPEEPTIANSLSLRGTALNE